MEIHKGLLFLLGLFFSYSSFSAPVFDIVEDSSVNYVLQSDGSCTIITSLKQKLSSVIAVQEGQYSTIQFDPAAESVQLLEAYTLTPAGQKIAVPISSVFIRPSQASQDSPGFTNSKNASIIFPQLQLNAVTYVKWKITKKLGPFGFLEITQPPFFPQVNHYHVMIDAPAAMPLHWAASTDFVTHEKIINGRRIVTADLKNLAAHFSEPHMVAQSDVLPYFEASSMGSWQAFGKVWQGIYNKQIVVTPTVTALARGIVQNKTDLEAVKALYFWEINHITYVDVTNSDAASYTPHTPMQILDNGYGDCKDYSMLLIAFLKAIGIDAEVAMISWNNAYRDYPLPTTLAIDHAIIYLPKYHLFLNPTNTNGAFGTLDTTLSNKFVLVLAPVPFITRTPLGSSAVNRYVMNSEVDLLENGSVKGHATMEIQGALVEKLKYELKEALSYKTLAQQYLEMTPDGGFGSLTPLNLNQIDQPLKIESQWLSPEAVFMQTGTTYFRVPKGINFFAPSVFQEYIQNTPRQYPIVMGASSYHWDTMLILPSKFHVVMLPRASKFSNLAGSYHAYVEAKGHHLILHWTLTINQDIYAAAKYPALRQLLYQPLVEDRRVYGISKD